jgi:hypothetical protein
VQRFSFKIGGAAATDFELERDNLGISTEAGYNLMAISTPR